MNSEAMANFFRRLQTVYIFIHVMVACRAIHFSDQTWNFVAAKINIQAAVPVHFGVIVADDIIDKRSGYNNNRQRKVYAKQADEREKLSPLQHGDGYFKIIC